MPSSASITRPPPWSSLFPYTTLFRSGRHDRASRRFHIRGRGGKPKNKSRRRRPASSQESRLPILLPATRRSSRRRSEANRGCRDRSQDRKSTRLNSSHSSISYAVFCFDHAATTVVFTLSLHDALPIWSP